MCAYTRGSSVVLVAQPAGAGEAATLQLSIVKLGAWPWTTPSPGVVSPSLASASLRMNSVVSVRLCVLATVKSQAR
jgi:hypothetical protein